MSETDPKVEMLIKIFSYRGYEVTRIKNGITVGLEGIGIPGAAADFYILRNNPEQMRSRIVRKANPSPQENDQVEAIRQALQEGAQGAAEIGPYKFFGERGKACIYYSHIKMEIEASRVFKQQKAAEAAFAQLKGIDSRALRQGLDAAGLARSSIVRVALSRIFRNAVNIRELLSTINLEARKIIQADQWELVRSLKESNGLPFINRSVGLLWAEILSLKNVK
ncbi:MAG: hypothetical protein WBG37_14920 [Desulfobacterales bacterium]